MTSKAASLPPQPSPPPRSPPPAADAFFPCSPSPFGRLPYPAMIRIREIADQELRKKIVQALAERRGCTAAAIPEWFELDDADYVDLLNDIRLAEEPEDQY